MEMGDIPPLRLVSYAKSNSGRSPDGSLPGNPESQNEPSHSPDSVQSKPSAHRLLSLSDTHTHCPDEDKGR
jgi:hypothetical protein